MNREDAEHLANEWLTPRPEPIGREFYTFAEIMDVMGQLLHVQVAGKSFFSLINVNAIGKDMIEAASQ